MLRRVGEPAVFRLDVVPFARLQTQLRQLFHLPAELLALGVAHSGVLDVLAPRAVLHAFNERFTATMSITELVEPTRNF